MRRVINVSAVLTDIADRQSYAGFTHRTYGFDELVIIIEVRDADGTASVEVKADDLFDAVDVFRELQYVEKT